MMGDRIGPQLDIPDTTDVIDPLADDPVPEEITDREDPSWVDPAVNETP